MTSPAFDRLCVVLVSTRNPLNIGAAARAMCNFGFQHLRVVHPYDAAFREARSAVGASRLLEEAEEYSSVAEAVADCTLVVGTTAIGKRQLEHPLYTLKDGAAVILEELLRPLEDKRRVAIIFGPEKSGLSNDELSHCHWLMHVPTGGEQSSMNLGQAVAVCLYELARDTKAATPSDFSPIPASAEELERVTAALLDALHASGYMGTRPTEDKEETVRRLVRRMNFPAADISTWLGMFRQILWKLRSKE